MAYHVTLIYLTQNNLILIAYASLHLHPNFVYANSDGSEEYVPMPEPSFNGTKIVVQGSY